MARRKIDPSVSRGRSAAWVRLYICAEDIASLPPLTAVEPTLARVQEAFLGSNFDLAVETLARYFDENGLDPMAKPQFDHEKFAALRYASATSVKELAAALDVDASAISKFANGEKSLRPILVYIAAAIVGAPPAELISDFVPKPRLAILPIRRGQM